MVGLPNSIKTLLDFTKVVALPVKCHKERNGKRNEGVCKGVIIIMGHGIKLDKIN